MFLYFGKRKLRKKFVMFQETETLKKLLILTFLAQARKNFLYFWKRSLEKLFCIFQPEIFREKEIPKKFFLFQETELSYISRKVYSEPSIIHGIFETNSSFRLKQCTKGKVYLLFFKGLLLVLAKSSFWSGAGCWAIVLWGLDPFLVF